MPAAAAICESDGQAPVIGDMQNAVIASASRWDRRPVPAPSTVSYLSGGSGKPVAATADDRAPRRLESLSRRRVGPAAESDHPDRGRIGLAILRQARHRDRHRRAQRLGRQRADVPACSDRHAQRIHLARRSSAGPAGTVAAAPSLAGCLGRVARLPPAAVGHAHRRRGRRRPASARRFRRGRRLGRRLWRRLRRAASAGAAERGRGQLRRIVVGFGRLGHDLRSPASSGAVGGLAASSHHLRSGRGFGVTAGVGVRRTSACGLRRSTGIGATRSTGPRLGLRIRGGGTGIGCGTSGTAATGSGAGSGCGSGSGGRFGRRLAARGRLRRRLRAGGFRLAARVPAQARVHRLGRVRPARRGAGVGAGSGVAGAAAMQRVELGRRHHRHRGHRRPRAASRRRNSQSPSSTQRIRPACPTPEMIDARCPCLSPAVSRHCRRSVGPLGVGDQTDIVEPARVQRAHHLRHPLIGDRPIGAQEHLVRRPLRRNRRQLGDQLGLGRLRCSGSSAARPPSS